MIKNIVFFTFIVSIYCNSTTAEYCQQNGYQKCLTNSGQCTMNVFQCGFKCSENSDCPDSCCVNDYCTQNYQCNSDSYEDTSQTIRNTIIIVVIVIFSVVGFCIFISITSCIIRKIRQSKIASTQPIETTQQNNHNTHNRIQFQQQMNIMEMNQQMQMNQILYQTPQQQYILPIQHNKMQYNPIQFNPLYPMQNEQFQQPQQQQMQQIPQNNNIVSYI